LNRNLLVGLGLILLITFLILSVIDLDRAPPAWWDEGWTLSVARNWVELGHYGHLINGQPRAPGLDAAFPVVAPVALSFRIFGVGMWQGRLPSVIYLFGSMALVFYLTNHLYNRAIAIGSLFVLLFLSGPYQLHPLTIGRTVLGEMPMIFYLLSGYAVFFIALQRSKWLILLSGLLWGIAINTKAQTLPFWLVSLLIPLTLSIIKRWWQPALLIATGTILAWFASIGMNFLVGSSIPQLNQASVIPGLIQVLALVLEPHVRRRAIIFVLTLGLPTLLGVISAAWRSLNDFPEMDSPEWVELLRWSLLGFTGSWLAWWVTLALAIDRYLFPAIFVGSIFTSALIYNLTSEFNFKLTLKNVGALVLRSRKRHNFAALLALLLISLTFPFTLRYLFNLYSKPGASIAEVTQYIENLTDKDSMVETYESELYFLLDRDYHYPPDVIDVQIISKELLGNDDTYEYDPLAVDPDLLVIGPFADLSRIYDQVLSSGEFRLIKSFPGYEVYAREK
jgi:4-amino-4-deoxy-L-arabinose transferase-like glycosyltransferase